MSNVPICTAFFFGGPSPDESVYELACSTPINIKVEMTTHATLSETDTRSYLRVLIFFSCPNFTGRFRIPTSDASVIR